MLSLAIVHSIIIGRRKGLKILQEEKRAFSLKPNSASYLLNY